MEITEKLLDELHQLKLKRVKEIEAHGKFFYVQNSTKTFLALANPTGFLCEASAPVRTGNIIQKDKSTSSYYVTEVTDLAGAKQISTIPVTGHYTLCRKSTYTSPTTGKPVTSIAEIPGEYPHFGIVGCNLNIPFATTVDVGTIIKVYGTYFRVADEGPNGCMTSLTIESYDIPGVPQRPPQKEFGPMKSWKRTLRYE